MKDSSQRGIAFILELAVVAIVIGIAGFVFIKVKSGSSSRAKLHLANAKNPSDNPFSSEFSRGKCQGKGTVAFTHLPMDIGDISTVQPYGVMVDAHVIPTSHGYFYPTMGSARDAYPVYAIADGFIVNISHRGQAIGDNSSGRATDEYQLQFEHSCTFYSYYDLLTSLSPDLKSQVGELKGFDQKSVRIPVKAGQLVGRVGGQSVDFGVWNFEKPPAKFVNPDSYKGDEERFYLDDMFAYFTKSLQDQILTKNPRTAAPRSGRVDYDIDGKLVGNWFQEGSGGFAGPPNVKNQAENRYWDGHLAIVYDFIDPTQVRFSIGNWEGKARQFAIVGNTPDPATIGVDNGLVKLELQSFGGVVISSSRVENTVLLQLIEPHKLKLETFPGKSPDQVSAFTSAARTYVR